MKQYKLIHRRHCGLPAYTVEVPADTAATYDSRRGERTHELAPEGEGYIRIIMYPWNWEYDAIVAALVNARYTADAMQAIVNNYLASPTSPSVLDEFTEMQSWRSAAKEIAASALAGTLNNQQP